MSTAASDEEIRAAYRRLVKETHPDTGGDAEAFKLVSRAYAVLSDGHGRAEYDAANTDSFAPAAAPAAPAASSLRRQSPGQPQQAGRGRAGAGGKGKARAGAAPPLRGAAGRPSENTRARSKKAKRGGR